MTDATDNPGGGRRGRRPTGAAKSPAERKRIQRARDLAACWDRPSETWCERECLAVLQSAKVDRSGALARRAWTQLGVLRGFLFVDTM